MIATIKMKVCFLTTSYPNKDNESRGVFVHKLVTTLKQKIAINVLTLNGYKNLTGYAGIIPNLKNSWKAKLLLPIYCAHFFIKIATQCKNCDIIHANWMPTAFLAITSKPLHNKKILLTERSSGLISTNNKFLKFINKFVFTKVNSLIAISQDSKKIIEKNYQIKNVKVIPNGVEKVMKKDKNKLREELKLPKNTKIINYTGRITSLKGLKYLIEAFSKIAKNYKRITLIIVGHGEELEDLKNTAKSLIIEKQIMFTGPITQNKALDYMQASDIFILPSLGETGGNVLLEARACGLPIITTKVGWAEELIQEGRTGFFINKKDSKDIYEKIEMLLENDKLLKKLTKNSQNYKIQTWEECASQYIKEYKKLVSS